jgi:hypothetical protein
VTRRRANNHSIVRPYSRRLPGPSRWRQSCQPRVATLLDSLLYLFPQKWAAGRSRLSAATAEVPERVRRAADRSRIGTDWRCSPNRRAERNSNSNQYFRHHLVILGRHVNLFPGNEAVLRLVPRNSLASPNASPRVDSDIRWGVAHFVRPARLHQTPRTARNGLPDATCARHG